MTMTKVLRKESNEVQMHKFRRVADQLFPGKSLTQGPVKDILVKTNFKLIFIMCVRMSQNV